MSLFRTLATLGPIGFSVAPGTVATLATIPFVIARSVYFPLSAEQEFWALCVVCLIAWWIISQALETFPRDPDPSAIVLDEVAGCLVSFFAVPINWQTVIIGFTLFRFFDITKPYAIKWCEQLIGGLGVLADDIAAGIATMIVLHGLYRIGLLS